MGREVLNVTKFKKSGKVINKQSTKNIRAKYGKNFNIEINGKTIKASNLAFRDDGRVEIPKEFTKLFGLGKQEIIITKSSESIKENKIVRSRNLKQVKYSKEINKGFDESLPQIIWFAQSKLSNTSYKMAYFLAELEIIGVEKSTINHVSEYFSTPEYEDYLKEFLENLETKINKIIQSETVTDVIIKRFEVTLANARNP